MKKQINSVINKISFFSFKHIAPVFGLDGKRYLFFPDWTQHSTEEEYKDYIDSLSPDQMNRQKRLMRILLVLCTLPIVLILLVILIYILYVK